MSSESCELQEELGKGHEACIREDVFGVQSTCWA